MKKQIEDWPEHVEIIFDKMERIVEMIGRKNNIELGDRPKRPDRLYSMQEWSDYLAATEEYDNLAQLRGSLTLKIADRSWQVFLDFENIGLPSNVLLVHKKRMKGYMLNCVGQTRNVIVQNWIEELPLREE